MRMIDSLTAYCSFHEFSESSQVWPQGKFMISRRHILIQNHEWCLPPNSHFKVSNLQPKQGTLWAAFRNMAALGSSMRTETRSEMGRGGGGACRDINGIFEPIFEYVGPSANCAVEGSRA